MREITRLSTKLLMVVFTFKLLFLRRSTSMDNQSVYYIIPLASILPCPTNNTCMTITEYFQTYTNEGLFQSNLTLYFLPGQHILQAHNYSVVNASNVNFIGITLIQRKVDIICNEDSKFSFIELQRFKLEALRFLSCSSVTVFGSHVCEVIDITVFNTSLYLHLVLHLIAENTVISNADSHASLMEIQNCTGIISNLTVENNTVTEYTTGRVVSIAYSSLHITGSISFLNNTRTLSTLPPNLLHMKHSLVTISAHFAFSRNTYFYVLWVLSASHINLYGELVMHLNSATVSMLGVIKSTFYGLQTEVNISHNICNGIVSSSVHVTRSVLVVNGTTSFHSNFAGGSQLRASFNSDIVFLGDASFLNNVNDIGVINLESNSILHMNATSTFKNNVAQFGGAIAVVGSSINSLGKATFVNNSATEGGAIYILNSNMSASFLKPSIVSFHGETMFVNNSATKGGALYGLQSDINVSFSGITIFTSNRAKQYGAHLALLYCDNCHVNFSGNTTLEKGISFQGGMILMSGSTVLSFNGVNIFSQNSAVAQTGNILSQYGAEIRCHGKNNFVGNEGGVFLFHESGPFVISGVTMFKRNVNLGIYGAGAIFTLNSSGTLQGYAEFVNNTGSESLSGTIGVMSSNITLNGTINFKTNSAKIAAGLYALMNSNVMFLGETTFASNVAQRSGGGVGCIRSNIVFHGYSKFEKNEVQNVPGFGGAIHAVNCKITLKGMHSFHDNKASNGGAISLASDSKLSLKSVKIIFLNNSADLGGAMYAQDTMSPTDCSENSKLLLSSSFIFRSDCFFVTDHEGHVEIEEVGNYALSGGNLLHGGKLNRCTANQENGDRSFLKLINNASSSKSSITSQPYTLCFCINNTPNCGSESLYSRAIRGEQFAVSAAIMDQMSHTINGIVRAELPENSNKTSRLGSFDSLQSANSACTELRYRTFSENEIENITIYAEGPCGKTGSAARTISVIFLPCPDGFQLIGDQCSCSSKLQLYADNTTECNVDGQLIKKSVNFWLGALYSNDTYVGLILYSHCPFDYCKRLIVNFTLINSDEQCNFNRSGILCGQCKSNRSLMLGGSMCSTCSNHYIALFLVFILAGVALVVLLIVLKLTVATGMVNGLIFYANIVALNRDIFFPPGEFNWLKVFIAWLNLDLGIQVCFFNGMDTYIHTWLQFLFPLYIWTLVGVIIVISHHSTWITRQLGSNPVAVLATLFLMQSYFVQLPLFFTLLKLSILMEQKRCGFMTGTLTIFKESTYHCSYLLLLYSLFSSSHSTYCYSVVRTCRNCLERRTLNHLQKVYCTKSSLDGMKITGSRHSWMHTMLHTTWSIDIGLAFSYWFAVYSSLCLQSMLLVIPVLICWPLQQLH